MNYPEKLATQGTHDTRRRQPKQKHNTIVADITTRKQEQTTQTRDEPPKKQRPIQKRISVMLQMH